MFPALPRAIKAPTGGDEVQMGMVVTIASMCIKHHDGATPEHFAPHFAQEIIQALHSASHQRT